MQFTEAWVEHFKSRKEMLLDLQNYGVDLAKLPKSSDESVSVAGVTGTFRKLNVD